MIAAVTNYYNPEKRHEKWTNFQAMQQRLRNIPLYIVEAAFGDDPFTLPPGDNVIQIRCRDVIWQQYTLVNLAINRLPDKFDKAVWIDADIIFDEPNWHHRMSDLLDQFKVVQSFSWVTMLQKDGKPGEERKSVTKVAIENSAKPCNKNFWNNLDLTAIYASGFSWGVQREVVEKFRIYDYWITGSCDTALVIAIWGDFQNPFMDRMNDLMKRHYMEWAVPFNKYINQSVYYLNTHISHLYHGYRNYRKRWVALEDLNPYTDIELTDEGCLQWCSKKPEMHRMCERMCRGYDVDFKPYL